MPISKKENGKFVESYEINSFNIDIDQKRITVNLSKYTTSNSGLPVAEDFSYAIFDGKRPTFGKVTKPVSVLKRSETGSILLDESGNPITETVDQEVEESGEIDISPLSEIVATLTSGKSLYAEIKLALYKSFIKYYLKGDTSYTTE